MALQTHTLENPNVIEYVTFKQLNTASSAELMQKAVATDAILDEIDGYIKRYISRQDNGTWVEVVFWRDMDAAKIGLDAFLAHPDSKPFLDLIAPDSVVIEYSQVI